MLAHSGWFEMSSKRNRGFWNSISKEYQEKHGTELGQKPMACGVWRIPESDLNVLGDVKDRDVLELGCGAAQWTLALRQHGARAVGLDLSDEQLAHARRAFASAGATSLVASPEIVVAQVSRVLRPGGLFAFCMSTPIRDICFDEAAGRVESRLSEDYFQLSVFDDGESRQYQRPYGAWIRLFRRHGFVVEDLVELQAPEHAVTTYSDFVPVDWARRWPAEHIWKLKKAASEN
jgi:SAM-dependent methyltransferase